MAITVDKARSARVRHSNSQSGKNAPWRSFGTATSIVPTRVSRSRWRYLLRWLTRSVETTAVFGAADGVSLDGEDLVDKPLRHLAHQIRRWVGEQIIQIGCRVDRMRCSGHRHRPFGEMW